MKMKTHRTYPSLRAAAKAVLTGTLTGVNALRAWGLSRASAISSGHYPGGWGRGREGC